MKYSPLLILGIAVAFGDVSAVTVINYGSTAYVTGNATSQRSSTSFLTTYTGGAGRSEVVAYDESTPISPLSSAYSGPTFYGGWYRSGDNATTTGGSNLRRVVNNSTADYINATFAYYVASNATSTEGAFVGMFLKADFSTLNSTPNLTFDLSNPLSMTLNSSSTANNKVDVRWMVKDGSSYYVSNVFYATSGTFTLSTISSTTWALFDPNTSLDFDAGSASFGSHTFTDVQGVGFYAQSNSSVVDGEASAVAVNAFSANMVPEPSTVGLAAAGLAALLWRVRRRAVS